MNVTSKGRYALRIMLDLARHTAEGYVSLKTVAERQGVSMKYMESIAGELKKGGLLESIRGKEGGYRLCGVPGEISAGRVLRCVEENLAPVSCIRDGSLTCERGEVCLTAPMWMELDEQINNYLDSVTLEDLLTGSKWK